MSSYFDTSAGALDHCESMSNIHPDLSDQYSTISDLFSRKLWHQLTMQILAFVSTPSKTLRTTAEGTNSYLALYDRVVLPIDKKLNQLSLARIASAVANSLLLDGSAAAATVSDASAVAGGSSSAAAAAVTTSTDGEAARAVLENLLEKKTRLGPSAALYVESKLALLGLTLMASAKSNAVTGGAGNDAAAAAAPGTEWSRKHLEFTKEMLSRNSAIIAELADSTESDSAIVHSAYYECAMIYRKAVGPPEAYYREAVSYLNYTPLESLTAQQQYELATDLSLAALTGEGVFNFGEVVHAPILSVLRNTDNEWLIQMMDVSARGDVPAFHQITEKYATAIQNQPALVHRANVVKEKITLLALVNMIFERSSSDRTLQFDEIAKRIHTPKDRVEIVIMRALSLGLIKGYMDQVDETVTVTWVMPRVLDTEQLRDLSKRFSEWAIKVSKTRDYMMDQIPTFS